MYLNSFLVTQPRAQMLNISERAMRPNFTLKEKELLSQQRLKYYKNLSETEKQIGVCARFILAAAAADKKLNW